MNGSNDKKERERQIQTFEEMMNGVPGGVGAFEIGENVNTLFLNDEVVRITGYERTELEELIRADIFGLFLPEERDELIEKLLMVLQKGTMADCNLRIRKKNKEIRWINFRVKKVDGLENRVLLFMSLTDIEDLKQNELDAKIQRQMFELAISQSGFRYWEYDIPTKKLYRSNTVQSEVGLEACVENVPESLVERGVIHPDYVDAYINFYHKIQEGKNARLTFKTLYDNNEWGWLDISYKVFCDEEGHPLKAIGIGGDVSQIKRREEEYKYHFEQMRDICTFTVEQEYKDIVLVEQKTHKMYQYFSNGAYCDEKEYTNYETVMGKVLEQIVEEDQELYLRYAKMENIQKQLKKNVNGTYLFKYRSYDKNKEKRWMEFQCAYFRGSKDIILILIWDINDRIQEEKENREKIEEALHEAEVAGNAKAEFLSHMSHEIRTPLNGIKGILDILKERDDLKEDEYLDKAIISTKHLMSIVNDILDMSKISSGKLQIRKEWVTRESFNREMLAIAESEAREKGVELTFQCTGEMEMSYIDRSRLKQVMFNIISNAIKYTHRGGKVEIIGEIEPIKEGWIRSKTYIKDNGIGMSQEFIDKAFEPFSQEARDLTQVGTGLGLAITKQLMELMGGSISIASEVGKGTTVCITFDAQSKPAEDVKKAQKTLDYKDISFKGYRCLLVEDNEINAEIAKIILEKLELEVDLVENGQLAVDRFAASEDGYYDVIFMDILMPVKDGMTATKEIRKMNRKDAKKVLIVAMTANAFMDDVNKSLACGMDYHLSKPFEKEQIIEILCTLEGRE